jgi:SpoVK/Ycf46/Vps4 family AAA+-type ATPase
MSHQQQTSPQAGQQPLSSDTGTSDRKPPTPVETIEYRRFTEFCDACRRYRYIGLCYGAPGVGKTLSAQSYSRWDVVRTTDRWSNAPIDGPTISTVFYTPPVVNTAGSISSEIRRARETLRDLARRPLRLEKDERLAAIRKRDEEHQKKILYEHDWLLDPPLPEPRPTCGEVAREYVEREVHIADPTSLILVDEADRLRMAGLEQVRAIFDDGHVGLILIGMPGLEKRLARYPQFYSRIGFVHEFRPLATTEIRRLLDQRWMPADVNLPAQPWADDAVAAIIRITGGNFRLLNRLLTQMERILEINALREVTKAVVEAARENLVIGQS